MDSEYSYNLILLGGTGARCGEIFIHMCANGYFTGQTVRILYIDSDKDNGNAGKLMKLIQLYQKCRKDYMIPKSPVPAFFRPEIMIKTVTPVEEIEYFKDLIDQNQKDQEERRSADALMRALYSDEECNMKITDGFFARPNVGAAVFAANMDRVMREFLADICIDQQDGKKIKIFMIGSIFGGTGASSLPTISKYLKKKLYGESSDMLIGDKLKIGACMVLPYFSFSRENVRNGKYSQDRNINIAADKFLMKTISALEYYKYMDSDPDKRVFDSLYVYGHDGNQVRGLYEISGSKQLNMPHIVEFYAAMSGVCFFESAVDRREQYFAVISSEKITWKSLYKPKDCFSSFMVMMRFSIVLKSLIIEELFEYNNNFKLRKKAKDIPWYYDFLSGKEESLDMDGDKLYDYFITAVDYCDEYIRWFAELDINDIQMREYPNRVQSIREDADVEGYLTKFVQLFSKELILRQHTNNMISQGTLDDNVDLDRLYKENIEYIEKFFSELEKEDVFNDIDYDINFNDIWRRLCSCGFSELIKDDNVFKNIVDAEQRTMAEGVRNLINAIYISCMF